MKFETKVFNFLQAIENVYKSEEDRHDIQQMWLTVSYFINRKDTREYKSRIDLMLGKTIFLSREEAEKALKGGATNE